MLLPTVQIQSKLLKLGNRLRQIQNLFLLCCRFHHLPRHHLLSLFLIPLLPLSALAVNPFHLYCRHHPLLLLFYSFFYVPPWLIILGHLSLHYLLYQPSLHHLLHKMSLLHQMSLNYHWHLICMSNHITNYTSQ